MLLVVAAGCRPDAPAGATVLAGRHGILVAGRAPVAVDTANGTVLEGTVVPAGSWFPYDGEIPRTLRLTSSRGPVREAVLPPVPGAVVLASVSLGRAPASEAGFSSEDVACFSADGTLLAVGTEDGVVRLFSVPSMQVLWQTRIGEGAAKALAFSANGRSLIVAEQSPRGRITALAASNGRRVWSHDLAEDLGGNASAGADPAFARFSLPAAYRVMHTPNGTVIANGVHGWTDGQGARRNRSRIYCLDEKSGRVSWVFPAESVLSANVAWFDVSPDGSRIVAAVSAYGVAPPPQGFEHPPGSLLLIDAVSGELLDTSRVKPAGEAEEPPALWRALAFAADGGHVVSGWLDGQLLVFELDVDRRGFGRARELGLGAPRRVGDVTVCAPISLANRVRDGFALVAAVSRVPGARGVPVGALHPNQNTLFVIDVNGDVRRRWQPPFGQIDALAVDRDGDWVAVGVAPSEAGDADFLSGVALAETSARVSVPTPSTFLSLGGRLSINPALSPSGEFLAVVERPLLLPDAARVRGAYRVLVAN